MTTAEKLEKTLDSLLIARVQERKKTLSTLEPYGIDVASLEAQYIVVNPKDLASILDPIKYYEREIFLTITLNGRHEIIQAHIITKGLVNRTIAHPREVFRAAIADNAAAVIIAHNHPSGNQVPSTEDDSLTERFDKVGELIGIPVLDHIIIAKDGFYSYAANGKI